VENFSEDLIVFLENTLDVWKYFVLNIRADSSCSAKLFCSPTAMTLARFNQNPPDSSDKNTEFRKIFFHHCSSDCKIFFEWFKCFVVFQNGVRVYKTQI